MTSIALSSDDGRLCQEVGARLASVMGFDHVDRSLLAEIAQQVGFEHDKLVSALDPGSYRKLSRTDLRLALSHIRTATLTRLMEDEVVCTGLGAHLYVRGVSHLLTVHLVGESQARVDAVAEAKGLSPLRAAKLVRRDAARRSRWSLDCFGTDEADPANFDVVNNLDRVDRERVVEMIVEMASHRKLKRMTYSQQCLADLLLASRVRTALVADYPKVRVSADGDRAIVEVRCPRWKRKQTVHEIKRIAGRLDGVGLVEVHVANARPMVV